MPPPVTPLIVTLAKVPSESLKPRSLASIRRNVSSIAVIVELVPDGASALSSATLIVETATLLAMSPSVTVTLIVRDVLVPPAVGSSLLLEKVICSIAASIFGLGAGAGQDQIGGGAARIDDDRAGQGADDGQHVAGDGVGDRDRRAFDMCRPRRRR